jgi:hypothetical protein
MAGEHFQQSDGVGGARRAGNCENDGQAQRPLRFGVGDRWGCLFLNCVNGDR